MLCWSPYNTKFFFLVYYCIIIYLGYSTLVVSDVSHIDILKEITQEAIFIEIRIYI